MHRLRRAVLGDVLGHIVRSAFDREHWLCVRVRSQTDRSGYQVIAHLVAVPWEVQSPEAWAARVFENRRLPRGDPWLLVVLRAVVDRASWFLLAVWLLTRAGFVPRGAPRHARVTHAPPRARTQRCSKALRSPLSLPLPRIREADNAAHSTVVGLGAVE